MTADDCKFRKVDGPDDDGCCAYEVTNKDNFKLVGYVFARRVLSYRGAQGWNSGIRLADFHPKEWFWSLVSHRHADRRSYGRRSRKAAVNSMLLSIEEPQHD